MRSMFKFWQVNWWQQKYELQWQQALGTRKGNDDCISLSGEEDNISEQSDDDFDEIDLNVD